MSKFPKVWEHERKLQTSFKTVANAGFLFWRSVLRANSADLGAVHYIYDFLRRREIEDDHRLHSRASVVKCLDLAAEKILRKLMLVVKILDYIHTYD